MSKHTKEPWKYAPKSETRYHPYTGEKREHTSHWITSQSGVYLALSHTEDNAEANAARIVACVNACEGLADPSVVSEMLNALRSAREALEQIPGTHSWLSSVNHAIARAEGKK